MGAESITMRAAAQAWLSHLQNRRRPIKISSARSVESCTDKWILPRLGNFEVSVVGVAVLRDFIGQLDFAGLALKSRIEIAGAVKAIIANCTNQAGEPLYPRQWDNERLDLPMVNHSEWRTPILVNVQSTTLSTQLTELLDVFDCAERGVLRERSAATKTGYKRGITINTF